MGCPRPTHCRRSITVFVITIGSVLVSCGPAKPGESASSADMEAINRLHQRDIDASKAWDVETLVSLWADDIVTLPPDGPPVIGKDANRASLLRMRDASADLKITAYDLSFSEIRVVGDWAFEWGTFSGSTEPVRGGPPFRSEGKLLRVLKRQPDGWKIARTIYNGNGSEENGQ
jgi:ketosteroid isomerase-like protein